MRPERSSDDTRDDRPATPYAAGATRPEVTVDAETLQTWIDEVPFHAQLGPMRARLAPDGVEIDADLLPTAENSVGTGIAHGGVAATILDTALAFALIAATDRDWSTVDLRVDYVRPVAIGAVRASATVLHAGTRVGRAEGALFDADGRLCTRAVGTFVPAD